MFKGKQGLQVIRIGDTTDLWWHRSRLISILSDDAPPEFRRKFGVVS